MFKYIKWELLNEFRSKKTILLIFGIIYLLIALLPFDNDLTLFALLFIAFIIILYISLICSFIYGAKRTIDSYKNQTFLLESMISLPPSKLLLTKYLLSIFFNALWFLLFVIGVCLIFLKSDINLITELIKIIAGIDFKNMMTIVKSLLTIFLSTITFTSLSTLIYVGIKSFFPNSKIGCISTFFISYIVQSLILQAINFNGNFYAYIIYTVVLFALCYYGTVFLVENKLEVYN